MEIWNKPFKNMEYTFQKYATMIKLKKTFNKYLHKHAMINIFIWSHAMSNKPYINLQQQQQLN